MNRQTNTKVDSTKTKEDAAGFDDSYAERFLRNVSFDGLNSRDNL